MARLALKNELNWLSNQAFQAFQTSPKCLTCLTNPTCPPPV